MSISPFKFLDSYTLEDRAIFFGRDQEITELYRRVFESKILLVYGISGTGKSSLINCGLASRFDDSDWLPVNVRRGNNIIDSLNEAFDKQAISPFKKNLSITEKLQSIYLDHFKPVYLIFDQFEELFIFGSAEEKSGFIKLIKEVVDSKVQCRVIFVIREEFLAGITEFENDLPDIFTNRFRVEKMKRSNAIQAVEGPCKVYNIKTESGFSEELVDKLSQAGNEIELTFLQIFLDRIFRIVVTEKQQESDLIFSKELLNKAGSVSDLLGQFLEEQIGEMEDPNTATSILKSFVSVQGTKKQLTESDIADSTGAFGTVLNEAGLIRYLEKFVDLRILRERDESGHFELRHDALAAKIYEKFTLIEKELLEVRLFVENAYQAFNTRKTFLSRDDLDYLSTYEKRLFLSAVLNIFIQDSKDKLQSQQRALRRLTSLVAIVFLIIVAAGVQFYLNNKGFAQTKELTTLALLQEKVDPLTSINTAFKIREKDSVSTVVQGIILSSFFKLLEERLAPGDTSIPEELLPRSIPVKGSILSMRLNSSGTHLFGWTDIKELYTYALNTLIVKSFVVGNEVVTVEMSPDAKYLAVVYKDGQGDVYRMDGTRLFSFMTTVNYLMNNRLVRFFPSGKYFMAAVKDNTAVIYDSTGITQFDLIGHTGQVNSLDISPDGRFVATASCDKSVLIWNFNHKTHQFSPYDTLLVHKDTIWSCEFNNSGKYLLTASADSTLKLRKLDGSSRYTYFFLAKNSRTDGSIWNWTGERSKRFDTVYSYLNAAYNRRIFDARFAANNRIIVASNYYNNENQKQTGKEITTKQVLYYDYESSRSENPAISYIRLEKNHSLSDMLKLFEEWEIASDLKTVAAYTSLDSTIELFANDGYQYLKFVGNFPKFSGNGKILYYIQNKNINCFPVSLENIYTLVFLRKIFGNPEKGDDILKIL